MNNTRFESKSYSLEDTLNDVGRGKLQLPDFQRPWVWDDDHIKGLLASVSVSFPIGALMLLESGGETTFRPRLVAGVDPSTAQPEPNTWILDGQQRLTSLYCALKSGKPVKTRDSRGKSIRRWYYIDMEKSLSSDADREDAILSVPEDGLVKEFGPGRGAVALDLSFPEYEYERSLFPARFVFDAADWQTAYIRRGGLDKDRMDLFLQFQQEVIKRFDKYQIPVIEMKRETSKEAVCLVFERVNQGGVSLTVFELLTAMFAASNYLLRDDWEARKARLDDYPVLTHIQATDFLQAVCLVVTEARRRKEVRSGTKEENAPGISCKRRDILRLEVGDWEHWADRVEAGFVRAAKFLHEQKVFRARDVPYRTQVAPLAAILTLLGTEGEGAGIKEQIARWYWCGVLGEMYGGATESRFAFDLPEVVKAARGTGPEPRTLTQSNFQAERLRTLRTRNSAAYKGIHALLMRSGCEDFLSATTIEANKYHDENIDIHHIFPKAWCERQNPRIPPSAYNSSINKTALTARTNRIIGGRAPSVYLPKLEKDGKMGGERMNAILKTHGINADAMRHDDFWMFYRLRARRLLSVIEEATGKSVQWEPELFEPESGG